MIHIEPSELFRAVKERVEFDDKERKHLDKCEYCREILAVFENYIAEAAAEKSLGRLEDEAGPTAGYLSPSTK